MVRFRAVRLPQLQHSDTHGFGLRFKVAYFLWGFLMPFGTNYLRMKADEYRSLAAATNDHASRLQLLNLAERYDREADQNERQHQQRTETGTASR